MQNYNLSNFSLKMQINSFKFISICTHTLLTLFLCQAQDEELEKAIEDALEAGYRHIDTAHTYENEHVIGRVLNRWLSSGRLKRKRTFHFQFISIQSVVALSGEDLFIVTKLPPRGNRPEGVQKYIKLSLEALQLSYVDVYLIHTPFAFNEVEGQMFPVKDGKADLDLTTDHVATWKVLNQN